MNEFKIGDIVTNIRGQGAGLITIGKNYQVVDVSKFFVYIISDDGRQEGWGPHCFEPVHPKMVEPDMSLDEILQAQEIYRNVRD